MLDTVSVVLDRVSIVLDTVSVVLDRVSIVLDMYLCTMCCFNSQRIDLFARRRGALIEPVHQLIGLLRVQSEWIAFRLVIDLDLTLYSME